MLTAWKLLFVLAGVCTAPTPRIGANGDQLERSENSIVSSTVKVSVAPPPDLGVKSVWLWVCLIVPASVGLVVMVTVGCIYGRRWLCRSNSYTLSRPDLDSIPCQNEPERTDSPRGEDTVYKPPNPLAVWHGTLDIRRYGTGCRQRPDETALQGTLPRGPECSKSLEDDPYEAPPLQYADLVIGTRGYETIRRSQKTSYADIGGELKSLDRKVSYKPFTKKNYKM